MTFELSKFDIETLFLPFFHPFIQLPFFPSFKPSIQHRFMFSCQFPFLYFLRLLKETNRFLQMHFNLKFPWLIFNLGHLRFPHRNDFHVYDLYFYSCARSSYTVSPRKPLLAEDPTSPSGGGGGPTGVLPARFFCQHSRHCRLAVTSIRFFHTYLAI